MEREFDWQHSDAQWDEYRAMHQIAWGWYPHTRPRTDAGQMEEDIAHLRWLADNRVKVGAEQNLVRNAIGILSGALALCGIGAAMLFAEAGIADMAIWSACAATVGIGGLLVFPQLKTVADARP